jgi:F0F1-type ATP synthase assembly protein I
MSSNDDGKKHAQQIAGFATELGMTMGLTAAGLILLGLWTGRQVDRLLGTQPYATIMLLIAGVVIGQVAIIRLAMRSRDYFREEDEPDYALPGLGTRLRTAGRALTWLALPAVLRLFGLWLDRWLGTRIIFSLGLVVVGLVVSVVGLLGLVESMRTPGNRGNRA